MLKQTNLSRLVCAAQNTLGVWFSPTACLSQRLTPADHRTSRGGIMCPTSLSCWDLIWPTLAQILHVHQAAVSSSVGLPCCIWKLLPGFYILPAPPAMISEPCGDGAVDIVLLVLSIREFFTVCTLADYRSLCLSPSTANRNFSEESQ